MIESHKDITMEQQFVNLEDILEELRKLSILKKFLDSQRYTDVVVDNIFSFFGYEIDKVGFTTVMVKTQNKTFVLPVDKGRVRMTEDFVRFYEGCKKEKPLLVDSFSQYLKNSLCIEASTKSYGFLI